MNLLMSRVVVLLHGINTRGVWQKQITPTLAAAGYVPYPLDYGNFRPFMLWSKRARNAKVEWLHEELDRLRMTTQTGRVSAIAHSFGTYLLGGILRKYPEHEFDKLILVGSILERDYPWTDVLDSGRVGCIRNEFGVLDPWPRRARKYVRGAGDSGCRGFDTVHERLENVKFNFEHSDYFSNLHCEKFWLPVLRRCHPNTALTAQIRNLLSITAQIVAQALNIGPPMIRANVFVEQEPGKLSIPPGFHIGMSDPLETGIRIDVGRGACGRAYAGGRQIIARLRQHWGDNTLPDEQLRLVHKDLKWIISTPIRDISSRRGFSGVVNVDSIGEDRPEEEHLTRVLPQLVLHANGLAKLLKGISQVADRE